MPVLHIGSTISHYKIVEKLGEGGMGVVYKAQDTTLERAVALKFLADHLLNDTEAKERFLREAKAAAALHHPNVCPVHEIDEADGKTFIAMAFLEGESLEERIAKGPLAIKDALDIARQVAEGLQAAHSKNVVHRDIKPANILISPDGRPTIMDFGLARLTEASRLTKVDTAMGTVAYMSPEQAQGMEVDSRTDLWSLGCVIYEMISGQRPFQGQYDQALLYEIVHEEPAPLTGLRTGVPMELEFIVGKCLAKDRDDRYGSAQEIAKDLRTLAERLKSGRTTAVRLSQMTTAVPAAAAQTTSQAATIPTDGVVVARSRPLVLYALLAIATLAFLGMTAVHFTASPPQQPSRRFSFAPPTDILNTSILAALTISPNGRHIAYVTSGGLWVQDLDQDEPRRLAGTEGAVGMPFWSPNSEFIGYVVNGGLHRVSVQGGASGLISAIPEGFLGSGWSPDGESIFFSSLGGVGGGLYKVSAEGGEPTRVIAATEFSDTQPLVGNAQFVTGTTTPIIFFTVGTIGSSDMYVRNLDTGQTASLGPGDHPVYSSQTGDLIYQAGRTTYDLWARSLSLETLQFTGPAFPLRRGARQPSVSDDGTLVYLDASGAGRSVTLVWRNRDGKVMEAVGQPQPTIAQPALSPDGRRVAVRSLEGGNADIWVHDLARSTKTRLTFEDQVEANPAWSPSGNEVAYRLEQTPNRILSRSVDGTGEAVSLAEGTGMVFNPDWSPSRRYMVYEDFAGESQYDIRYVELGSGEVAVGQPITFLGSPANERNPEFSPDGRFLAYNSDESGVSQLYIRPFPDRPGRWQASVSGGAGPRWRADGRELYYTEGSTLTAVSVSTEPTFTLGKPQRLFDDQSLAEGGSFFRNYDVAKDGQRFLMAAPVEGADASPSKIRVILNWYEEFRNRQQ